VQTFAGQQVTFSFYAKSSVSSALAGIKLRQNFGSGGSAATDPAAIGQPTITSSWARYSVTGTVESISGKTVGAGSHLLIQFAFTLDSDVTVDTWGWQLEAGSVATGFQTATGTLQGELAACQRYYYRQTPNTSGRYGAGQCISTTTANIFTAYPVTMRISPTALEQSGTAAQYRIQDSTGAAVVCSAVPVFVSATTDGATNTFTVASGVVAGNATMAFNTGTLGFLGWSAEL
jgi:hypothetical protein